MHWSFCTLGPCFPTHQFPKKFFKERPKMKCKDNERRRCESQWSIMAAGHVVMYAWLIFSHTFNQCVSLGQLYKSLLCASSNPKLCCSSYLIGYALFAALREMCASLSISVNMCVRDRCKGEGWPLDSSLDLQQWQLAQLQNFLKSLSWTSGAHTWA